MITAEKAVQAVRNAAATVADAATTAVETVVDVFGYHDREIEALEQDTQRADEEARHHREAERTADAKAAELRAILDGGDRLRAVNIAQEAGVQQRIAARKNAIAARPTREHTRYAARVTRIWTRLRTTPGPLAIQEENHIAAVVTTTNIDELERHQKLGPFFSELLVEIRDVIPWLRTAAQRDLIAQRDAEMERALESTLLEDEIA